MRLHWKTKKHYLWIDVSVWWKSLRFGFWYDNWCMIKQLNIYFLFWDIEIRKDKISKYFEEHTKRGK